MAPADPSPKKGGPLPAISVVVVSRDRGDSLLTCLHSLAWQYYPSYEVIVVGDAAAAGALAASPYAGQVKLIPFDAANISAARNLGVAAAAGDVVAFIDDDAAAEPNWLCHLGCTFRDGQADAAGGYVRGRNGISYQWRARSVDRQGRASDLNLPAQYAVFPDPPAGQAVKTEGTNMAVRRDVLVGLGGFDEAFRFYLDETDLNLRLAAAGYRTAIVPLAQVHHAYAPSPRRTRNRGVRDLSDVGASTRVFWRKHCPDLDHEPLLLALRQEQRHRLLRQRRARQVSTEVMQEVLQSLEDGLAEGAERPFGQHRAFEAAPPEFLPFTSRANGQHRVLAGRWWSRRRLLRQAEALVAEGCTVSLFLFSHTSLFHRVRLAGPGLWLQQGGLFGRSERDQPVFWPWTLGRRAKAEADRVKALRQPRFDQ